MKNWMKFLLIILCFGLLSPFLFRMPHAQTVWTVTVTATSTDNSGNQAVTLLFNNGQGRMYSIVDYIPFGAAPTQVSDFASTTIAGLNSQQTAATGVPSVGSTVTPTAASSVAVDPNAAIKATFATDYLLLREYQTAISHGLITTADLGYIAQLSKVTTEFVANESILLPVVSVGP